MPTISVHDFADYRIFLRAALGSKAKKMSLRAFARFSGVSATTLSRVMSGKRGFSAASASAVSRALEMSPEETAHFINLIELDEMSDTAGHSKVQRSVPVRTRPKAEVMPVDAFQAISDWHNFAILALTKTRDFRADSRWIARRLGIKPIDARMALERLVRLRLIKKDGGRYRAVNDAQIETPHDTISTAVKENHRQHLNKAAVALREIDVELREFVNTTLAMNLSDVPKAKKRIRKFLDSFSSEIERNNGHEVCQINVQFYVLTK